MKSLLVFTALLGSSLFAKGPQENECRGGACLPEVTEEQKAALAQHKEEVNIQLDPLREDFRTAQQKWRDLQKNGASSEEIAAQKKIVDDAAAKMKNVREENQASRQSLLTPEQKKYVEERQAIRETRQKAREARVPDGSGQGEKQGNAQRKGQGQKRNSKN